ncbi:MAG: DUF3501 family protein [Pseudomonadota bacterium]|nr:DUF3501 family protein [Pseudomonadota bacterium]
MQKKLSISDLFSLEDYALSRKDFRDKVLKHKKQRQIILGAHVLLQFEDRLTMQYQIQEMLRIEKIFEPNGIQSELDAYNPLIPDGQNWKATMLIEYEDSNERQEALRQLIDIESLVWIEVDGLKRNFAIADEDMDRSNSEKTAAVHFLRFEISDSELVSLEAGGSLRLGIDHPEYKINGIEADQSLRTSLLLDLDKP